MQRVKVFILLVILFAAGVILYSETDNNTTQITEIKSAETNAITVTPIPIGLPERLVIESLGVEATVEGVGLNAEGSMDIPKDVYNVAWYNLGYKPGEIGNAVIAGHLDTQTGDPSVFYNLLSMREGERIKVIDNLGNTYTFKVVNIASYPHDEFPLVEVFGDYAKKRLNLITCGGDWNRNAQNYSHRTVVYSELEHQR
ncbi:class F sortase [Candidatus Gottesmanbacteria bacterium]|nr:class F sortase [Candidatus Gottesmanbacteria bacterium]